MTPRRAYVAVIRDGGFSLGIAIEGEAGYNATNLHTVPSWDEARRWAEAANARLGLTETTAFLIVASTIRAQNAQGVTR